MLSWNNKQLTLDCLASLQQLDYPARTVILVDNASSDGTAEAVKALYPDVTVIENATNLGYAGGNNVGIRTALALGAEYVLVLNNDTLVHPALLTDLVAAASDHPEAGMLGPTVYCTEPPDTLFAAGSFVDWLQARTWHRGMFEPSARYDGLAAGPVDFLVGCGVLVSRRAVEAVGMLDQTYYLNFEDVDWGIRCARCGFEVRYVPEAKLWHRVSATLGLGSPINTYYMTRNSLLFFWRNAPVGLRLTSVLGVTARTLRTTAAWSLKPEYRAESFRRRRAANLLALRDFFTARLGCMGPDVTRALGSA